MLTTMEPTVAAFTDTYLPTVNGVTYTIQSWRRRWQKNGGRMDVVYPRSSHAPEAGEYPVKSVSFPFYEDYRLGAPQVPEAVTDVDLVHAHTAFALGLAGLRLARRIDVPLVASYHTPTGEYTEYVTDVDRVAGALTNVTESYERWYFDRADLVVVPSEPAREHIVDEVGVRTPVRIVSNGVDTGRFRPVEDDAFRNRYDLEGTLIGYTGRHGYEKRLQDLIDVAGAVDATIVLGGDGPARADLEARAEEIDADIRFLGFLDREEMPAFYSTLDVFAFPSPVETQGLVALEAYACGTPVVGANGGALSQTINDGVTGYHFKTGNVDNFANMLRQALSERERLAENCLDRRRQISIDRSMSDLADVYKELLPLAAL
ncbi:MAG: glycosyltransferase involved in cell wall biosynthesis [Halobacteriales archaeon]|jgi:glycosyltransferase involved in cell wall biosynthesis